MPANYAGCRSLLVVRFGELIRKLWNRHNFKGQVSPHEFMQARYMLHVTCYKSYATAPQGLAMFESMLLLVYIMQGG
jgi:hypothetical protein